MSAQVDLTADEFISEPQPFLNKLRAEQPLHWNDSIKAWFATRYDDVRKILADPAFSVEKFGPAVDRATGERLEQLTLLAKVLGDWIVFMDPPRHTRVRRAMRAGFMPKEMKALDPKVKMRVDQLLDPLMAVNECEYKSVFGYPLPALVIGDLFGVHEDDVPQLKPWGDALGKFVLGGRQTPDRARLAFQGVKDLNTYIHGLVDEHRKHPQQNMTTHLIDWNDDGDVLTNDEIVHAILLALWAGYETTANLLTNSVLALIRNPELQEILYENPDKIPAAVDEFLRYEGAAQTLSRLAKTDVEIGGQTIKAGERVFVSIFGANHDPERFENPDKIDVDRKLNRHMGFGHGIHLCLGAPLARMEGILALEGILNRFKNIRLAGVDPEWRDEFMTRSAETLQITYDLR